MPILANFLFPEEHRHSHFPQRRLNLINGPLLESLIGFPGLPDDPVSISAPALNRPRRFSVKARILRRKENTIDLFLIIGANLTFQCFNARFYCSHGSPPSGAGRTSMKSGHGLFARAILSSSASSAYSSTVNP
jgi:hypothetical protein